MYCDIKDFFTNNEVSNFIKKHYFEYNTVPLFSINFSNNKKYIKLYFNTNLNEIRNFSSHLANKKSYYLSIAETESPMQQWVALKQNNDGVYKYIALRFNRLYKPFKSIYLPNTVCKFQGISIEEHKKSILSRKYFKFFSNESKKDISDLFKINFLDAEHFDYTEAENYYKIVAYNTNSVHNIISSNKFALDYLKKFEKDFNINCVMAGVYNIDNLVSIYFYNDLLFKQLLEL